MLLQRAIQALASYRRRKGPAAPEQLPIPSASLRYRVTSVDDLDLYLEIGNRCSRDIRAALTKIGRDMNSFHRVLDFGCGAGRVLRWFSPYATRLDLYGTDTDAEAIAWCRKNLRFARFAVNNPLPPLGYSARLFDLVYAISVFTHLNEEYQFRWLNEFKRVTQPRGIVLLTVHGQHSIDQLPPDYRSQAERLGLLFIRDDTMKDIFPDWYQLTFHTRDYIAERYTPYFDLLEYIPRGLNDHQDVVVLRNR